MCVIPTAGHNKAYNLMPFVCRLTHEWSDARCASNLYECHSGNDKTIRNAPTRVHASVSLVDATSGHVIGLNFTEPMLLWLQICICALLPCVVLFMHAMILAWFFCFPMALLMSNSKCVCVISRTIHRSETITEREFDKHSFINIQLSILSLSFCAFLSLFSHTHIELGTVFWMHWQGLPGTNVKLHHHQYHQRCTCVRVAF